MKRVFQTLVSTTLAICIVFQPAYAADTDPLPVIGEPVQLIAAAAPEVQPAFTGCGGVYTDSINAAYEQRMVDLVNQERANVGLPPLKRSASLDLASRYHAKDMMVDNYFGHDTQDLQNNVLVTTCIWSTRLKSYYANWEYLAENVAAGYLTPEEVISGWMRSTSGHRENILNTKGREIGVGFMEAGGKYTRYWVQDFGASQNVYPLIINREAASTNTQQVNLYIYGQGTYSEMRLRNNSDPWSGWQPFQANVTWTLPAIIGTNTVSVEMRNASVTVTSSDTIYLNGGMGNLPDRVLFIYNLVNGRLYPEYYTITPQNISGSVPFNWTVTNPNTWLQISPTSGASPNTSFTITTQSKSADQAGSITITANMTMPGSPKTIPIQLIVTRLTHFAFLPTVRR